MTVIGLPSAELSWTEVASMASLRVKRGGKIETAAPVSIRKRCSEGSTSTENAACKQGAPSAAFMERPGRFPANGEYVRDVEKENVRSLNGRQVTLA